MSKHDARNIFHVKTKKYQSKSICAAGLWTSAAEAAAGAGPSSFFSAATSAAAAPASSFFASAAPAKNKYQFNNRITT